MSQLNIYRASAGSGKTFKITEEYLKLLFTNHDNYRYILSVTFTNMATEEMKTRILSEIYNLSSGANSDYMNILMAEFSMNETAVRADARKILEKILHDYSRFSVETIESFFQKIIRSFIRETGINSGYDLEFNTTSVLNEAIERLFGDIDKNPDLKRWLVQFAESRISAGKSWDMRSDILQLSYEVLKEEFLFFTPAQIQKFTDRDFLFSYRDDLQKIIAAFNENLKKTGNEGMQLMSKSGLSVDDFSYKNSGVAGYIAKLAKGIISEPGSRVTSALGDTSKWYSKTSPQKHMIENCVNSGLNDILMNAVNYYQENFRDAETAEEIMKSMYSLGILLDISKKIQEYCSENNVLLISETTKLLSHVIGNSDAPFVYEKTGFFYKHFMIDEFQDTSGLQWNNFRPLIDNSLSEDNKCMLVGDVKQSIYRWRNGKWSLLSEEVAAQYGHFGINDLTLNFNWRSKKNIVDFNNSVFEGCVAKMQEKFNNESCADDENDSNMEKLRTIITEAYKDIRQELPSKKYPHDGYVNVSFLEKTEDSSFDENVLEKLPSIIEGLQDRGYGLDDIAIITRDNKHGSLVAGHLLEYKLAHSGGKYRYDVISNESLIISKSSYVNFIIGIIRYFDNPSDMVNNACVIYHYITEIRQLKFSNNENLNRDDDIHERLHSVVKNPESINEIFLENEADPASLEFLSLYEMTENIMRIFGLNTNKNEIPYLQTFQDLVLDFVDGTPADRASFLEWWKNEGSLKSLKVSGKQDAITLITIHKSKGLQYKVVIIPFCNWDLDSTKKKNIIWCKPGKKPFDRLEKLPLRYSSGLARTIFYKEYYYEKVQQYIDNLNLLYVACTRAEDELYVFAPSTVNEKISGIGDILCNVLGENGILKDNIYESGKRHNTANDKKSTATTELRTSEYNSFPRNTNILLKKFSTDYFSETEERINKGNIFHSIFEKIITVSDIDKAVNKLFYEGKINSEDRLAYLAEIQGLLSDKRVSQWYMPGLKVLTESSILLKNGETRRPDRVIISEGETMIIDYKFGNEELNSHRHQVKDYMNHLQSMGYQNIKGKIWYVFKGDIVDVE